MKDLRPHIYQLIDCLEKPLASDELASSLHQARLALMDYLACYYKGSRHPHVSVLHRFYQQEDFSLKNLWAASENKAARESASLLLGMAAHYDDLDDVQANYRGHPSSVIFSALFAVADAQSDLEDFLLAYLTGVEAAGLVGQQLQPQHAEMGWHSTATIGTLAAALAIVKLKRISGDEAAMLMSLAINQTSGYLLQEGTDGKPLNAGWAAQRAVNAYHLASSGLTANVDIFDSPKGWPQIIGGQLDFSLVNQHWFSPPQILKPGLWFKRTSFCSAANSAYDASLELYTKKISPSDITAVEIGFPEKGDLALTKTSPKTGLEGKFSAEYIVWLGLTKGEATENDFSAKPVLQTFKDFLPKIKRRHPLPLAQTDERPAEVTLTLSTGSKVTAKVQFPKGSPNNPYSLDELMVKWQAILGEKAPSLWQTLQYREVTLEDIFN
ncbi:MmgE/PrpD family protein [Streptococcus dentasini]